MISEKTFQYIRLFDMFVFAPFLVYVASKKELNKADRTMLVVLSGTTLLFNGYNYINLGKNKKVEVKETIK